MTTTKNAFRKCLYYNCKCQERCTVFFKFIKRCQFHVSQNRALKALAEFGIYANFSDMGTAQHAHTQTRTQKAHLRMKRSSHVCNPVPAILNDNIGSIIRFLNKRIPCGFFFCREPFPSDTHIIIFPPRRLGLALDIGILKIYPFFIKNSMTFRFISLYKKIPTCRKFGYFSSKFKMLNTKKK